MTVAQVDSVAEATCPELTLGPFSKADAIRVLATLGVVTGTFTTVGTLALCVYTHLYPDLDRIQSPIGLLVRVILFAGASLVCAAVLWYFRQQSPRPVFQRPEVPRLRKRQGGILVLIATVAVILLSIRVDVYPWAAPDEMHHLNVARNIAIHGSYASGHPDRALIYFDSFDSVGPSVLGPIAAVFSITGVSLAVARWVIVCFFLLLGVAVFLFARRHFGNWVGIASVAFLLATFSSTYLGRTVYGEVPAFAWLLMGLLAWSRSLDQAQPSKWGVIAGLLIGLAVLAKSIVVLVAFSLLAAWVYDRCTFRRIGWVHVVLPIAGGGGVLFAWHIFQSLHGGEAVDRGGVMSIYQHYLLFGLSGLPFNVANSIFLNPVAHAGCFLTIVLSAPTVFRHRYAPSLVVLYCYAIFMLYWWFFFTTGHLHRYLWNAYAIVALLSAAWCVQLIRIGLDPSRRLWVRAGCIVAVGILVAPGVRWISLQTVEIATKNEMVEEYLVVDAIAALPPEFRIGTTSGRLPALVSFLSGRLVEGRVGEAVYEEDFDVIVIPDTPADRSTVPPGMTLKPVGSFVLLSSSKPQE